MFSKSIIAHYPQFGVITGYRFLRDYYETIFFNSEGEIVRTQESYELGLPRP